MARSTATVLLVEDDAQLCTIVGSVLSRCGYGVLVADSAAAAFRIWEEKEGGIDLILTDLILPNGETGPGLVSKLQEERPSLKAIFTSGYTKDVAREDFELKEGDNFLPKPFDLSRLLASVKQSLEGQ